MASIPHFYSDYPFSSDEFSAISSLIGQDGFTAPHQDFLVPSTTPSSSGEFYNYDAMIMTPNTVLPPTTATEAAFPTSDLMAVIPTLLSDYNNVGGGNGKVENFVGGFQLSDPCEFYGEDCYAVVPNSTPNCCPAPTESSFWGMECNQMGSPATDQYGNMKVRRYSVEERKERILRYLKKRNQRNFNKTIKYACRKTLADRRVRVRGRFARNNELFEEETEVKKLNDHEHHHHRHLHHEKDSYFSDTAQIKISDEDDDEWLQEAVASLIYAPYAVAGG